MNSLNIGTVINFKKFFFVSVVVAVTASESFVITRCVLRFTTKAAGTSPDT